MAYKSIVVHVDSDPRLAARVEYSAALAVAHDAHLIGLHVLPTLRLPAYVRAEMTEEIVAEHSRAARRHAEELGTKFNDLAARAGAVRTEWRTAQGDPVEALGLHARYADLVVLGQIDPNADNAASVMPNFPELAAMHVGRPVVVVPYAGRFTATPKEVLVAWNASREATRAVTDALPLLARARRVSVLAINPRGGTEGHGQLPGADISLWLSRHGVNAEVHVDAAVKIDIGSYLLSRAADLEAELVVMGAYGHARLRELVFGGVTQTLMREMTVPVLLAH